MIESENRWNPRSYLATKPKFGLSARAAISNS